MSSGSESHQSEYGGASWTGQHGSHLKVTDELEGEMAATREYRQNVARDNAKVQYGDQQYGDQHHHYYARPGDGPDTTQMRGDPMQQLLASLSFPQQNYRFATIEPAHRHTCQWFLATPEYARWRDWELREAHHGILWLKGKPGVGKSTITKYALDHANATHTGERNISFFFNARGERLEKCNEGMYRSLLHQVAGSVPSLAQSVHTEAVKGYATTGWPLDLLRSLFREAALSLASNARLNCYIDALDEGEDEDQAREMVRFFEELAETAVSDNIGFSIYFASRHYPNITIRHSETLILDDCGGHHADIASYVQNKLLCRPPSLKEELAAGIIERSSGIFLWAVLVVRILNSESDRGNQYRLKESLQATPKGLDELFSDIIGKGGADKLLLTTLLGVLFAKRPLSPLELYSVVVHVANADSSGSVICDQSTVDEETIKNFITSSSRGLLQVVAKADGYHQVYQEVEKSRTGQHLAVQFIHESAREYLFERGLLRLNEEIKACSVPEDTTMAPASPQGQTAGTELKSIVYTSRNGLHFYDARSAQPSLLRLAVEIGDVEMTKLLLISGANVYSQKTGQRSIMEIARERSGRTIARLLTYFADVDPSSRFEAASALEDEEWWKEYVGRTSHVNSLDEEED